jgi:hypothetical protein
MSHYQSFMIRIHWLAEALFSWVKRSGREADHSPPSTAEVKNAWSYTSIPQYIFMARCLVKHRDSFNFTFFLSPYNRLKFLHDEFCTLFYISQADVKLSVGTSQQVTVNGPRFLLKACAVWGTAPKHRHSFLGMNFRIVPKRHNCMY